MKLFEKFFNRKKVLTDWLSTKESQIIGNQKVIEHLIKEGDKLNISREVFHWIYFKTESDRTNYLNEAEKKNFVFVSFGEIKDEFPLQLQIKRVDKVDEENVNQYVIYLWELAKKFNGNYDGWETSVETE